MAQPFQKTVQDAYLITRMAEKFHIQPRALNDELSAALYSQLLEALDDQRIFFTQKDIHALSVYQFQLDEEISKQQSGFLQLLVGIYQQRLIQADTIIDHISAKAFNFSLHEKYTVAEDTSYPADIDGIHTKIYKLLKAYVLTSIVHYSVVSGRALTNSLRDSLELRYRKKAGLSVKRSIKRILQSPLGVDNTIGITYCQVLATCYDPHTAYFPPEEKDAFEGQLGNKSLGFGLSLNEDEDGKTQISRIKPGSPAFQSGGLNEGDKILSIQWDEKEAIDVSGASLAEISEMLGTAGGTKMTLTVKKADGTTRPVMLHKERLNADEDEDKVKGFILKGGKTIGYISLPAFYTDWEDNKGLNGCANDVAREIIKMKKENMGGLILDLRYNGGGAIEEAVELSGIFIDAGPVAQIKTKDPKVVTLKDVNRGTVWDGPLLLLVNGSSASASEMVAGTLQDYNRALIVGSSTYGKATAQVVLPMDTSLNLDTYNGQSQAASYIKLTTSRLYRITGATAQMSGVQPNIRLPEPADALQQRESDEKFALRAPVIEANKYYKPLAPLPIAELEASAQKEMEADSFFREALAHVAVSPKPANRPDLSLFMDDALQRAAARMGAKGSQATTAGDVSGSDKNAVFAVTNLAYEKQRLQSDPELQAVNEERKKMVWIDPYIKIAYQLASVMIK
ncbi:MAG TPA: S41 family peptidase [Puia sp.]|nr:S41 family peptidase [Puia sp.]